MYLSGGIEVKAAETDYTFILKWVTSGYSGRRVAEAPDDFTVGTCLRAGDVINLDRGDQTALGKYTFICFSDGDATIGIIDGAWLSETNFKLTSYYPDDFDSYIAGSFNITTLLEKYNNIKGANYEYFEVTSIDTTGTTKIYLKPGPEKVEEKKTAGSGADTGKNTKPQLSAFERSLRAHEGTIKAAPSGSTVKIVGDESFNALPAGLIQEFMKKGDVDLEFSYSYKGQFYTITIPAGTKLESGIPWYGPMYLWGHFGNPAWTAR